MKRSFLKIIIFSLVITAPFLLLSCSSGRSATLGPTVNTSTYSKMDMFLQSALTDPDVISEDKLLVVFAQLDREYDVTANADFSDMGLFVVESLGNGEVTVRGTGNQIKQLATLPYVVRLRFIRKD